MVHIVYAAYVLFIHGMVAWLIHLSTLVRESVLSFLQPFLAQKQWQRHRKWHRRLLLLAQKCTNDTNHILHQMQERTSLNSLFWQLNAILIVCCQKKSQNICTARKFIQIKLFIFCQRKLIDMRKLPVLFIDGVQRLLFATKVLFLHSLSLGSRNELKTSRLNIFETSDVKGTRRKIWLISFAVFLKYCFLFFFMFLLYLLLQCFLWWLLGALPNGHEVIHLCWIVTITKTSQREMYFPQERNLFSPFFRQKSISITMPGNPCQPHKRLENPLFLQSWINENIQQQTFC